MSDKSISCLADNMTDEELGAWVFTRLGQITGHPGLLGRSIRQLFKPLNKTEEIPTLSFTE